jgi:hypothetical protein
MQLGESHHRIPDTGAEPCAQPRLGQLLHRRQPRHPRVARLCAQRRRHRPRDAGASRGGRMEGAGGRMHGGQQRDHPHAIGPQDHLRQGGAGGGQGDAARRGQAEGPERLEARGQAPGAPGHHGQGHRQAGLRRRPQAARHAQCGHQGLPGVRRQGQELQRRCHRKAPGREESAGRRRQRGGRRGRHLVARQDRARRAAHRMGQRPERRQLQRQRGANAQGRAGCERCGRRQPERRRQGRAGVGGQRASRRCIPTRTRTTRPWSP